MSGWVKIHRCLQGNELWCCEKFTRGQAWVDLIILANHESSYFFKRGVRVNVSRGQLARSEVELADRWKWSRNKVRGFLEHLKIEQQISIEKSNITQVVTIINYDKYQDKRQQPEHQAEHQIEQQMDGKGFNRKTAEGHIQEGKEVKNTTFNPQSIRPEWITEDDWRDLIAHRKAKKAANTERAYRLLIEELKKAVSAGFSIGECIDAITTKNWTGFKVEWMANLQGRQERDSEWI